MQEIWKEVKALTGIEVSNFGNVRSWRCKGKPCNIRADKPHLLSQKDNGHGYKCINIRENGKSIHLYVHRIVAEAFIPNPNNYPEVNHKDENMQNNKVNNLEWCNHSYNQNYGNRNKKVQEKLGIKINQYDLNGKYIKTFNSITEAQKECKTSHINKCLSGEFRQTGGYIWKYADKNARNERKYSNYE